MIEFRGDSLSLEIKTALLFLLAMLVTSGIAFFKDFYKIKIQQNPKLSAKHFLITTFIFLFVRFFVSNLVLLLGKLLQFNLNSLKFAIYANISLDLLLIFLLYQLTIKNNMSITKEIFKINPKNSSITQDVFIGFISWIVIFPIVSFFDSISNIFILLVFKIKILPDQLAINFFKSTLPYPLYFALALIMILVLAPIIEEYFFRGILQNYFKKFFKRSYAIVLASIIFSLFHFSPSQKLANITIIGSIFILGCFLGFLYEKQKSLISNICLHSLFNAVTILNIIFFKGE